MAVHWKSIAAAARRAVQTGDGHYMKMFDDAARLADEIRGRLEEEGRSPHTVTVTPQPDGGYVVRPGLVA